METIYWDPFEEMRRIHEQIDRMFSDFLSRSRRPETVSIPREPLMDLIDEGKTFRLVVEVPGIDRDDLDVRVTEDTVTIRAEKKEGRDEKKGDFYLRERAYTSFYRTITLPEPVIPEQTKATYRNGVLELQLVKKEAPEEEKGFKVKIE